MKRKWIAFAVALTVFGCADEEAGTNDENGTNNAGTNGGTNGATNGGTNDVGRCIPAIFVETLPFDADDALPFSFDIPAGFGNIDSSSLGSVGGSIFDITDNGQQGEFQTHFVMDRDADGAEETWVPIWLDSGFVADTVDLDGTTIDAWTRLSDDTDETKLYFDDHLVTFQWLGPANCLEERRLIQETMLGSFSRNPDTTF